MTKEELMRKCDMYTEISGELMADIDNQIEKFGLRGNKVLVSDCDDRKILAQKMYIKGQLDLVKKLTNRARKIVAELEKQEELDMNVNILGNPIIIGVGDEVEPEFATKVRKMALKNETFDSFYQAMDETFGESDDAIYNGYLVEYWRKPYNFGSTPYVEITKVKE